MLLCLDSSPACALPLIPFDTAKVRNLFSALPVLASYCKLLQYLVQFSSFFSIIFPSYAIYMTSRVARSRPQRCSWSTHNWASRSEPTSQKLRESYFSVRAICHTDKWLLLLHTNFVHCAIVQLCIWSFKFFKIVWIYFYYILYNIII